MTRIAVVLGQVTPPGRLSIAINGAIERGKAAGHQIDIIDLATFRLDFADGRPAADHDDDSVSVLEIVSRSEGVLLVSPVYRGTYTGALKNLLDLLPVEALQGKPVGIVAMGATQHHYLGVDFHLRDVLAWFGALTAPTSVYLTSSDFADGVPSERVNQQLDDLIATLVNLHAALGATQLGPGPLSAQSGK